MNLKKMLTYSAISACLVSSGVYAGGPDVVAAPAPCPIGCVGGFVPFAYIGGSAGWAYSNWDSFILGGSSNAKTNGFTGGGKIGFQFLDNFGIEGGGFILPNSSQNVSLHTNTIPPQDVNFNGKVKSWFAYGAMTMRAAMPFDPFFHVIGKVGGVFRSLDHSGNLYTNVGNGSYATVIFGGGLEYDLALHNLPLAIGVDYYYIPGSEGSFFSTQNVAGNNAPIVNENGAPAAQVAVATLSLRFAV